MRLKLGRIQCTRRELEAKTVLSSRSTMQIRDRHTQVQQACKGRTRALKARGDHVRQELGRRVLRWCFCWHRRRISWAVAGMRTGGLRRSARAPHLPAAAGHGNEDMQNEVQQAKCSHGGHCPVKDAAAIYVAAVCQPCDGPGNGARDSK